MGKILVQGRFDAVCDGVSWCHFCGQGHYAVESTCFIAF